MPLAAPATRWMLAGTPASTRVTSRPRGCCCSTRAPAPLTLTSSCQLQPLKAKASTAPIIHFIATLLVVCWQVRPLGPHSLVQGQLQATCHRAKTMILK
ncbi:hypothetical protein D3C86_1812650 [compost metagenome]